MITHAELLDFVLSTMIAMYFVQIALRARKRCCKLQSHIGLKIPLVPYICDSVYGTKDMSWYKITMSVLMLSSFVLMMTHGSLAGFIAMVTFGTLLVIKIGYTLRDKYCHKLV